MASITKYTSAKGERYRVQFRTPEGRLTQRRGFKTKAEAVDFAATTHVSKLRGEYIDAADSRITIGELGPDWLKRRTHLKPSSRRAEDSAWRNHVEPRWGRVKLADIKHSAVQQWVSDMGHEVTAADGTVTKRAAGPVTVTRSFGILAALLDGAVRDRRLVTNPARGVKLPRKSKREHRYLTESQVWSLVAETGRGRGGPDKPAIVALLAYCGLRWGELAGLHVADVDLIRRRVHIRRNAVSVGGTIAVGSPKTHERRSVPLPQFVADMLADVTDGKGRDAIVFPASNGGYAKPPGAHTWLPGAVERCQAVDDKFPRITAHDLRHTAASLAISAGANVKVVQKMLGHASAAMTLDTYADLFESDAETVADAHDARLAGMVFPTAVGDRVPGERRMGQLIESGK